MMDDTAATAAALDISRAWDRPDRTVGPVRSLAIAPVAATGDLYLTINRGEE